MSNIRIDMSISTRKERYVQSLRLVGSHIRGRVTHIDVRHDDVNSKLEF
jgi:Pyruvate/2-oxoacid:ferredoxin oxidoreductase gamma subunit